MPEYIQCDEGIIDCISEDVQKRLGIDDCFVIVRPSNDSWHECDVYFTAEVWDADDELLVRLEHGYEYAERVCLLNVPYEQQYTVLTTQITKRMRKALVARTPPTFADELAAILAQ